MGGFVLLNYPLSRQSLPLVNGEKILRYDRSLMSLIYIKKKKPQLYFKLRKNLNEMTKNAFVQELWSTLGV